MLFYFYRKEHLMGTAERRLEILKYLCKKRHATMPELSEQFGVSLRTIQRDIYEIETTFRVPIDVKCGKYDGGVYVIGNYSFDRAYMHSDEIILLRKIQGIVENKISEKESVMLLQIIKNYEKPA